jgi:hypothetical protein
LVYAERGLISVERQNYQQNENEVHDREHDLVLQPYQAERLFIENMDLDQHRVKVQVVEVPDNN